MALANRAERRAAIRYGAPLPRIAPPIPARSLVKEFRAVAAEMGIELFPWQETAARYLTALGPGDRWLFPEYAEIVSRQNGKTTKLQPLIVMRLRAGRRIMHTAQNRELPREVFGKVADFMLTKHRGELKAKPRFANGQEEIQMRNGGSYRIVAPTRGGARGPSNDDLIVDELREMVDHGFMAAAEPTLTASANPQAIFLSNAGHEGSAVLNAIKARAGQDASLAYLEWSAGENRATDDVDGWYESNPSTGHKPGMMEYLERKHRSYSLAGTLQIFNTEHLCRWTPTDLPGLLSQTLWDGLRRADVGTPVRPALGLAMDPSGTRASIALAWQEADFTVSVRIIGDVTGSPIDAEELGRAIQKQASRLGVTGGGYEPETDALLAKYLRKPESVVGAKFTAACSTFVRLAESRRLRWEGPDAMSEDIRWTARLTDPQDGTFRAVKAKDDRPITSVLAAIRAVSLASGPRLPAPRVM